MVAKLIKPLLVAATLCLAATSSAADWPYWKGPTRDCVSPEKGLLHEWPAAGPKVLWRVPIEQGWGSPSVVGGEIFFMEKKNVNWGSIADETVRALNVADGQERWHFTYRVTPYENGWGRGGPRCAPTVTDKYVYTLGVMGHLKCLDRATGKPVWELDLTKECLDGKPLKEDEKAFCQSPVLINGKIVLFLYQGGVRGTDPDAFEFHKDARVVGVDALTGKIAWDFKEPVRPKTLACCASTVNTALVGNEPCAIFTANRMLKALRASDGKEIWKFEHLPDGARGTSCTSLLIHGNYLLDVPDCAKITMVEADLSQPNPQGKKLWTIPDSRCECLYHNFVPWNGFLYGFDQSTVDPGKNAPGTTLRLNCVDIKTGAPTWRKDGIKGGYALIAADGLLFVRSLKTLTLVEANPKAYVEKGRVENLHNVESKPYYWPGDWVMPVLSNGRLYIRTPSELICYDVKAK